MQKYSTYLLTTTKHKIESTLFDTVALSLPWCAPNCTYIVQGITFTPFASTFMAAETRKSFIYILGNISPTN